MRLDHLQPDLAVIVRQHAVVGVARRGVNDAVGAVDAPTLSDITRQTDREVIAIEMLRLITAPIKRVISQHLFQAFAGNARNLESKYHKPSGRSSDCVQASRSSCSDTVLTVLRTSLQTCQYFGRAIVSPQSLLNPEHDLMLLFNAQTPISCGRPHLGVTGQAVTTRPRVCGAAEPNRRTTTA